MSETELELLKRVEWLENEIQAVKDLLRNVKDLMDAV